MAFEAWKVVAFRGIALQAEINLPLALGHFASVVKKLCCALENRCNSRCSHPSALGSIFGTCSILGMWHRTAWQSDQKRGRVCGQKWYLQTNFPWSSKLQAECRWRHWTHHWMFLYWRPGLSSVNTVTHLELGARSWFWSIAARTIFKIIIWCPLVDFPTSDDSRMKCLTLFIAPTKISLKEGRSKSSHTWNCSCRKQIQSNMEFFSSAIISSANREGFFCQWVAQWRALLLKLLMVYACTEKHTRGKEVWGCLALLCLSLQGHLKSEEQKSVLKQIVNVRTEAGKEEKAAGSREAERNPEKK